MEQFLIISLSAYVRVQRNRLLGEILSVYKSAQHFTTAYSVHLAMS